jgi:hypothetical protein
MEHELRFAKPEDEAGRFAELACLSYYPSDSPARRGAAKAMWDADPSLGERTLFAAACAGNTEAVRHFLAEDPQQVDEPQGPFEWPPLLYACYSRLELPGSSTLAVAQLLLGNGANPGAEFLWGGECRFTALTGVFGEGEQGPGNQPEHPQCEKLARLLLEAGADPHDSQALYNRMFTPGHRCLELLLEYGMAKPSESGGAIAPEVQGTLDFQLVFAVEKGRLDRVQLLVQHGADVDASWKKDQRSAYQVAATLGHQEVAEYLQSQGATKTQLQPVDRLASTCMLGDLVGARALVATDAQLVTLLLRKHPELLHQSASSGRSVAARTLVEVGYPIDHFTRNTALHEAAWKGDRAMVELLIELGADTTIRDREYDSPALGWAMVSGQKEAAEPLRRAPMDLFTAINIGDQGRAEEILDADPSWLQRTFRSVRTESAEDRAYDWLTPLAFAVLRARPPLVRLLLDRGADRTVRDPEGKSLEDLAADQPEVSALLRAEQS